MATIKQGLEMSYRELCDSINEFSQSDLEKLFRMESSISKLGRIRSRLVGLAEQEVKKKFPLATDR